MHCSVVAVSLVVTLAVVAFPGIAAGLSWTQVGADIDAESAEDESGYSIALSGDGTRLAIGAEENDGGGDGAGHVRVYDWNGTAWTQTGADIDGESAGDWSGWSVALSTDGRRVAIGAFRNDGSGTDAGHDKEPRGKNNRTTACVNANFTGSMATTFGRVPRLRVCI